MTSVNRVDRAIFSYSSVHCAVAYRWHYNQNVLRSARPAAHQSINQSLTQSASQSVSQSVSQSIKTV